jgi:RimJ/RimL family protein N-acetyltransferase
MTTFDFTQPIDFYGDVVTAQLMPQVSALTTQLMQESDTFLLASMRESAAPTEDTPQITLVIMAEQGDLVAPVGLGSIVAGEIGLAILAQFHNQGLGQLLMTALINWAQQQGLSQLWLEVQTTNAPAIHIYDKLGFVKQGEPTDITLPTGRQTALQRMELAL